MAKFWKSPEFEAQKKEWEEKLQESGFEDAETEISGERKLKTYTAGSWCKITTHVQGEAKLKYFMLIAQFVMEERDFDDENDKFIMEKTSDGWSITEISRELRKFPGRLRGKHNRNTIRHVRRRYETRWGIREWATEQMMPKKPPIR